MSIGDIFTSGVSSGQMLVSSALGMADTWYTNKENKAMARDQMAFQERMSNSAVQRRMADMKAAGINPILAGKYDASTPAGAIAPQVGFTEKAASAMSMLKTSAEVAKVQAETRATNANTNLLDSQKILTEAQTITERHKATVTQQDAILRFAQTLNTSMDTAVKETTAAKNVSQTQKIREETMILAEQLKGWKIEGKIDESAYGEYIRWMDRSLRGIQTVGGLAGVVSVVNDLKKFLSGTGTKLPSKDVTRILRKVK